MTTLVDDHQVHVWQADLNSFHGFPEDISDHLSPYEIERANNLKFKIDQEHFILRHYLLRLILSKYYNCQPREIRFKYNSFKKPFVESKRSNEIKFNMSSSDDFIIIGLCRNKDIGIDIEKVRQTDNFELIALDNFSNPELEYLNNESDKTTAFFNIWTRKEAFIKAVGTGIYFPLKSFSVDIDASGNSENLKILNHHAESKLWRTMNLKTRDCYTAALAIKSVKFNVLYFQL
jgi:4'-phosphopantetheinyl transferase